MRGVKKLQTESYDKIIIGAGLYGLYSALFCAKRGNRVLVLENDPAPFMRATYINQANIILLKYLDYTVVLPLTSLTYVWSAIIAFVFLKEKIFGKQMLGLAMIVCGSFLLVVN